MKLLAGIAITALIFSAGCAKVSVQDDDNGKGTKRVEIESPVGSLKVRTDDVNAKDTGLSVYPGATLKPNTKDDKHTANMNIDTPWFGVKVVALTYQSQDSPDKIKAYYQKEMSEFGRVLDCSPGSADLNYTPANKQDVSCREGDEHHRVQMDSGESYLKVGSRDKQHVVGYKKHDSGSEFTLVYVSAHGGEKETE